MLFRPIACRGLIGDGVAIGLNRLPGTVARSDRGMMASVNPEQVYSGGQTLGSIAALNIARAGHRSFGLREDGLICTWAQTRGYVVTVPSAGRSPSSVQRRVLQQALILHCAILGRAATRKLEVRPCSPALPPGKYPSGHGSAAWLRRNHRWGYVEHRPSVCRAASAAAKSNAFRSAPLPPARVTGSMPCCARVKHALE